MAGWLKQVGIGLSTAALISLSLQMNPAGAALTSKHPVDSGSAILANALPIDNKYMRDIQENLEGITEELNSPTAKSLAEVSRSVRAAQSILVNQKDAIKESFVTGKEKEGERSLEQLSTSLNEFTALLRERQKDGVSDKQREALNYVAKVDEAMVSGVPYKIPQEFAHLPALKREALSYVAKVDEAMVSGVPYEIPLEFAHLPALKTQNQSLSQIATARAKARAQT
eukprot:gene7947-1163_t